VQAKYSGGQLFFSWLFVVFKKDNVKAMATKFLTSYKKGRGNGEINMFFNKL
jgi:hypothetical protein